MTEEFIKGHLVSLICNIYVGRFLRSAGEGGKCAAAYVPPDWDGALKKKKTAAANETRRKAAMGGEEGARGKDGVGGEHLGGYDSLEGKCCLPTCLQGCQLHRAHTHINAHAYGR